MFGSKKRKTKNNTLSFESENYKMKDLSECDNLVVANLEFVSNNLMVETTNQKYLFETIIENDKKKYREVFTGFKAEPEESHYFNLPYVVNIIPLNEQAPSVSGPIPKYGLLILLNQINNVKNTKQKIKK